MKNRGTIQEGAYADLAVVDLEKKMVISQEQQFSKCGWTPFHGIEVQGWLTMTFVNGNVVFKNGEIIQESKGRLVEHA